MATLKHPAFGTTREVPDDQVEKWAMAGWTKQEPEDIPLTGDDSAPPEGLLIDG